jgi:hypothetical protein
MFIRGQVIAFDGNVHKGKLRRTGTIKGKSSGGVEVSPDAGFWTFINGVRTKDAYGRQWEVGFG